MKLFESKIQLICCVCLCYLFNSAALNASEIEPAVYKVNAGDILSINVWNEESVSQKEVLVRPDGRISIPIVGELSVGGKSIVEIQEELSLRLSKLLIDKPVVTASVLQMSGNTVFVLGKVARPGQFVIVGKLDVTQALALAGGTTTFARETDIKILRRDANGTQQAIPFNYSKIADGEKLESNILIRSGDVVLVP